ncbi:hypothetical protein LSTR_LSTR012817, partial [Laodelphax striatellus]
EEIDIEAVAVGAVLSDYQRIRVENVCSRLGLVALAYLWRRDQAELLQEMIDCNVEAVIIKVAALGLDPSKHLGKKISELQPHLVKMNEKYGLNICGEGGEYETFTLDMPLFAKSLVIEEFETVIHSNDAIAPVGYLNFGKMRLVDKENTSHELSLHERLIRSGCPVKNAIDYVSDIDVVEDVIDSGEGTDQTDQAAVPLQTSDDSSQKPDILEEEQEGLSTEASVVVSSPSGWTWLGGVVGDHQDIAVATKIALSNLCGLLENAQVPVSDLVSVCLYVRDMSAYAQINSEYVRVLSALNPPVRVCVETPLSQLTPVAVEAVAYTPAVKKVRAQGGETPTDGGEKSLAAPLFPSCTRHTMHVQGVSHWAPANIGPYSQSVRIGDMILVAGQIALVPGSMAMVDGGVRRQCRLSLRHVGRVIKAMDANTKLRDVVQSVCYVTEAKHIAEARDEWEKRTKNAIVDYVVVTRLPRDALVEWHVWAHRGNAQFEYEETGFVVGCNRVSLCRRWNYDNTISAVVCSVSAGRSVSSLTVNESDGASLVETVQPMSEEQLVQVFSYSLSRLNRNAADAASLVCVLRIFFRADRSPTATSISAALGQVEGEGGFRVVPTLVPVVELGHPNTFISICAVRHV